MESLLNWGFTGLFLASFLAATIVPFSSEIVLTGALALGLDAWTCVWVATLGNWLGGMTSYYLGFWGKTEWIEKYLRISPHKLQQFQARVTKFGGWFAFLSFVPFVGDVIAVATGFFRCNIWIVAFSMFAGKFARYIVWMYLNGLIFIC